MFNLNAITEHRIAQTDPRFDFDLGSRQAADVGEGDRPLFNPDDIRGDAQAIIAEARSCTRDGPWDAAELRYRRVMFPHLVSWIPDEAERDQLTQLRVAGVGGSKARGKKANLCRRTPRALTRRRVRQAGQQRDRNGQSDVRQPPARPNAECDALLAKAHATYMKCGASELEVGEQYHENKESLGQRKVGALADAMNAIKVYTTNFRPYATVKLIKLIITEIATVVGYQAAEAPAAASA